MILPATTTFVGATPNKAQQQGLQVNKIRFIRAVITQPKIRDVSEDLGGSNPKPDQTTPALCRRASNEAILLAHMEMKTGVMDYAGVG